MWTPQGHFAPKVIVNSMQHQERLSMNILIIVVLLVHFYVITHTHSHLACWFEPLSPRQEANGLLPGDTYSHNINNYYDVS